MEDQNKVVTCIKTVSDEHWAKQNSPVLLSALPQILEREIPDFRMTLGHRTLKAFIKETGEAAGYKLVEHPIQRARVSVAPAAADYTFPSEMPLPAKKIAAKSNQEATLAFFRALATLPAADLDNVVIPASVLVKLLK